MIKKKKVKIYQILIILSTLCMCIGYATVNSIILEVGGKVTAKIPKNLEIVNVVVSDSKNATGVVNLYDGTFLDATIELSSDNEITDTYVTLEVTLYNASPYTYEFNSINYEIGDNTYDNSNIIFTHTIEENKEISSKDTYIFYITYKYLEKVNITNNILNNKLSILFDKKTMELNNLILINEENPVEGTSGLYTYEETKKYYSGMDVNNYVWFNCVDGYNSGEEHCETWRIISIEDEIKMIRDKVVSQETIASIEEETLFWKKNINDDSKTNNMIREGKVMFDPRYRRPVDINLENSYCIRNNNGCNAYSKITKFGEYKSLNLDEDSAIKLYLENIWYKYGLTSSAKQKLKNSDYNIGLVDTNKNLATVISSEESIIYNTYIGLLNISDYMLSTTETNCKKSFTQYDCASNNWLNTGEVQYVLLNGRINATNAQVWSIKGTGVVYSQDSNYGMFLRPVVTIDKNIEASGSGTLDDYYVLY